MKPQKLLSPLAESILSDYRQLLPQLEKLGEHIYEMLQQAIREQNIEINTLEWRVKSEASLIEKLERKGNKYSKIDDVTDLLGLRIVTFYTDDVDKVAAIVKHIFCVDWKNSVDKRRIYELNSFGYLSLHYICRLQGCTQPSPLSSQFATLYSIPFEIQMRTALQHVWSAIEHDIGYKGAVKLPPEYRRQFSRLAGMLELADNEFSRLRTTMTAYRRQMQALVKSGRLDEVILSTDSFKSYLELRPFDRLNQRIAAVNQAELYPASPMPFLKVLENFGFETLGDVQTFVDTNSEDAYQLALSALAITDLDILSENIGLQNLCLVHVLKHSGGHDALKHVYDMVNGTNDNNSLLADNILQQASGLSFFGNISASK